MTEHPLVLSVDVRVGDDVLVLDLTFRNEGTEDILVLAYPGDLSDGGALPGRAYVVVGVDDPKARVSLIPPEAPMGANFGIPLRSLAQLIPQGERFVLEIELALPLRTWNPYLEALGEGGSDPTPELAEVRSLVFETEWHLVSDSMMRTPGPGPNTFWCIASPTHRLSEEIELPEVVAAEVPPE